VLLDFYCTVVDLRDPVRSRGSDDLARRLGLLLGPGEFYRRYAEMISSEPAEDGGSGFVPYRTSWLAAGRRLLAPFGRESAAGQFADCRPGASLSRWRFGPTWGARFVHLDHRRRISN
jgi:hypothetical protein